MPDGSAQDDRPAGERPILEYGRPPVSPLWYRLWEIGVACTVAMPIGLFCAAIGIGIFWVAVIAPLTTVEKIATIGFACIIGLIFELAAFFAMRRAWRLCRGTT